MGPNEDSAGVGGDLPARSGGQGSSICKHHQKNRCWFKEDCFCPHSLEIEEVERAKRCRRLFERKKKRAGRKQRSNPRAMSRRFNSLEESVNGAIEGMQEELRCFRLAVTEGDRVEKLEAENKGLECEIALLKKEKLQKDEELEKVRDKLGELEAKNKQLTDSLSRTEQQLVDSLSLTEQQGQECHTEMVGLKAKNKELEYSFKELKKKAQWYQKKANDLQDRLDKTGPYKTTLG